MWVCVFFTSIFPTKTYDNNTKTTERQLGENIHISYLWVSNASASCSLCVCWWMESQVCVCVCVRVRPALPGPLISARLGCNILLPLAPCGSLWKTSEPLMMNVSHEWGNVKLQLPPSRALPLLLQQYTHLVCSSCSSTGTTFAAVQRYTEQGQISKLSSPFSFGTNTALLPFYQKYIKVTEPLYIKIAMWQYLFFFYQETD